MTAQIAILVPVLGRPDRALPLAESAAHGTDVPYRLLFLCSPEDGAQIDSCQQAGDTLVVDWESGPGDYARKINEGYRQTTEPWVFTAADDLVFHPGWASEALRCAEECGKAVVGTNDCANPKVMRGQHSTHTLIARSYADYPGATWDGPGTVYCEQYDHQRCDDELVAVAMQRDEWSFAFNSCVEHKHWIWHTAPNDETYRKGMARGREDGRLFQSRHRMHMFPPSGDARRGVG